MDKYREICTLEIMEFPEDIPTEDIARALEELVIVNYMTRTAVEGLGHGLMLAYYKPSVRRDTIDLLTELCSKHDLSRLRGPDKAALRAVEAYIQADQKMANRVANDETLAPTDADLDRAEFSNELEMANITTVRLSGFSFATDLARLLDENVTAAQDFGTFLRNASRQAKRGKYPQWPTAIEDIHTLSDSDLQDFVARAISGPNTPEQNGPDL